MISDDVPHDFQSDLAIIAAIPAVPTILDVVCRTTGMGFAAVARVTEGRWVACSILDTIGFGLQAGGELKVDTTICHEIQQHHRPVVIGNVARDPIFADHPTPALYGFQSYISMPILLQDGSFFGTLCAIDPKPHMLDRPEVMGSFTLFAELIAFHLDAHTRIASSEAALSNALETALLREQFIAVLGHDLRNPLQAVSAGTRSMLRHPDRAAAIAIQVDHSIARMAGLIDNVLDFARGRLGDGLALAIDRTDTIRSTLGHVIEELQSTHPDRVIEQDVRLDEPVRCDQARVAQVLSNLLGNALTHGSIDTPVHIGVTSGGGTFRLSVSNLGPPIPPSVLPHLFEPFIRGAGSSTKEGLGLGLYIASEVARAHGGHMSATSTDTETCFVFQIPSGSAA